MVPEGESIPDSHLVGGVTSGWNFFRGTGRTVIRRAEGAKVWDVTGKEYIDWVMGWGSLLLGHNPAQLLDAIRHALDIGFGFQYESQRHGDLARMICEAVPCAEKVRLANSGTEATLHAVRVARRATGRLRIVKFEGHFHGLNDYLLFGVDSMNPLGEFSRHRAIRPVPGSGGLPCDAIRDLVIVLPYNDFEAVQNAFEHMGAEIAGVILEPVLLNGGCIAPDPGYLAFLRQICTDYGALLIFDEVLSGFRVAWGGAQERFGVEPDLVCLGKALGCGMPVAALGGRSEFMDYLAPVGDVEMAGTNTGRNMTVLGTIAALRALAAPGFFSRLNALNDRAVRGLRDVFARHGVPAHVEGFGGRIGIYVGTEVRPRSFRDVVTTWNLEYHLQCHQKAHCEKGLFGFMLPLQCCPEAVTLSAAHTPELIDETLNRLDDVVRATPYRLGSSS